MSISPFTNRALDAMRHSGYPFSAALCELIDNSIWHGQAKNIKIDNVLNRKALRHTSCGINLFRNMSN